MAVGTISVEALRWFISFSVSGLCWGENGLGQKILGSLNSGNRQLQLLIEGCHRKEDCQGFPDRLK